MTEETKFYLGTGRRKTSVARVRLLRGSGQVTVNERDLDTYFPLERNRGKILAPFKATHTLGKFDVLVNVKGGGVTGQADAVMLGIARALLKATEGSDVALRAGGFLTRDSREVERKKYGKAKARRGYQWAKR